ncbi:MAG TPA: glycoside hydrolase family 18 protein [Verrucomicrobiae bacterium]|nr:glycoside hydrolase family 18 protein [Verrucomicrobiae bacterium]
MKESARQSDYSARRRLIQLVVLGATLIGRMCNAAPGQRRVVGYYPAASRSQFPCTMVGYSEVTHIAEAFVWTSTNGTLIVPPYFVYPKLVQTAHERGAKIVISVGGGRQSGNFSAVANDSSARARFVQQLTAFCASNHYDGVDIDWEGPENETDRSNFTALARELHKTLKAVNPNLTLSAAIRPTPGDGQWLDINQLKEYFDWFGVMTYDFHGTWSQHSGYNAPLYESAGDRHKRYSVAASVQYYLSRNLPGDKLLIGIPFYAYQFNSTSLYATNSGARELVYADVVQRMSSGWKRVWDSTSRVPFLVNPEHTQLITYDDPQSVKSKCEYAVQKQLGGAIIWALGQDAYPGKTNELLTLVGQSLLGRH